jgi:hypothetical protein
VGDGFGMADSGTDREIAVVTSSATLAMGE